MPSPSNTTCPWLLLQEARWSADARDGWQLHPPVEDAGRWRIAVPGLYRATDGSLKPTRRPFASAIASREGVVVPRDPSPLHEVVDGEFVCSRPGQFAVGEIHTESGARVTVVSLYGIWDRMLDSGTKYPGGDAESRDLRPHADLPGASTRLRSGRGRPQPLLVLRWHHLGSAGYDRLRASGRVWLDALGPFRRPDEPRLERCPCPDIGCRHVNTFLYQSNPMNRPHQLDFFLAIPRLRDRRRECWADPDLEWPQHSDHRPILTAFDV